MAVGVISGGSAAIAFPLVTLDANLSDDTLAVIAQVGATLLVAYAVEAGWFIKASSTRGRDRENWIGVVTAIGLSSAVGITFAIAFIDLTTTAFIEALASAWMIFSLVLLGALVAVMPYVLYEWVHVIHTEYPDE
jgi:hypothetical protein